MFESLPAQKRRSNIPPRTTQRGVFPDVLKQRNISGYIIFHGLSTDRPDGSTEVKAWFSTDTGVLSIWDGLNWLSVTLS